MGIEAVGPQTIVLTSSLGKDLGHILLFLTISFGILIILSHLVTRIIRKLL